MAGGKIYIDGMGIDVGYTNANQTGKYGLRDKLYNALKAGLQVYITNLYEGENLRLTPAPVVVHEV